MTSKVYNRPALGECLVGLWRALELASAVSKKAA
jgi:hypothetical protein